MSSSFEFLALVRTTEQRLVVALELTPVALPAQLCRARGEWKGSPVTLEARAYRGPRMGYVRFVELQGNGLEIGNILCLGRPELGLPIFGADLVALGKDTGVMVADLSPVRTTRDSSGKWAGNSADNSAGNSTDRAWLADLGQRRASAAALPSAGELPAWCARWFSPHALFTRIEPASARAAVKAFSVFSDVFIQLARTAEPQENVSESVREAQRAYAADHRNEDRGLQLLNKMFGADFAQHFIREMLFPDGVP